MSKNIGYAVFIVLIGGLIGYRYFGASNQLSYNFTTVQRGNFVQEISAAGKVSPSAKVDLRFKNPGKIKAIKVKAGDRIMTGQVLAKEDSGVLDAGLNQARAGIDLAEAKFEQLLAGSSPEDIRLAETAVANAETSVSNAQKTVDDAQTNFDSVAQKASIDLANLYDKAKDTLTDSYNKADAAVNTTISSLFSNTNTNNPTLTFTVTNLQLKIDTESKRSQAGNAVLTIKSKSNNYPTDYSNLDQTLKDVKSQLVIIQDFLATLKNAFNQTALLSTTLDAYKASVDTASSSINTAITNINNQEQDIVTQIALNKNNINAAQTSLTTAGNALSTAKGNLAAARDQLALKKAPPRKADIDLAKAQISQSKASAAGIEEQIKEMTLSAPIDGVITDTNGNAGENVSPEAIVVSLMPSGNLEIDVDISESNIVSAKVEQGVRITLDAFPDTVSWSGKILSIDPAETLIGGSVYYKTKVVFDEEDDRIRSGMTANIWINADSRENVVSIPVSAVKKKNNKKYVEVLEGKTAVEREVETGPKGKDGAVEIVSGLSEGEKVITSDNKK